MSVAIGAAFVAVIGVFIQNLTVPRSSPAPFYNFFALCMLATAVSSSRSPWPTRRSGTSRTKAAVPTTMRTMVRRIPPRRSAHWTP